MTDNTAAPLGHNGGPALEEPRRQRKLSIRTQWAKALFADKRTPSYVIAMSWAIHWYSQDDGSGAALSNEQFEVMCGVPDRTVSRGKKWLWDHGYVSLKVGRSGQKTRFQMTIPDASHIRLVEPVEAATEADTARQGGVLQPAMVAALENSIRQGGGIGKEQDATEADRIEPIRHPGEVNPPERRAVGRQGGDLIQESIQERKQEEEKSACAPCSEDEFEKSIEPVVYQRRVEKPTTRTRADWAAMLGANQYSVTEIVNGQVRLLNGTHVEWLAMFGGDEESLKLALIEISGKIQPNSSQSLDQQVLSKLAAMLRDKRDRDERYRKGVERNAKTRPQAQDMAARRERIRKHAEEAAEVFERDRRRS